MLAHYVSVGVEELDRDKLTPLLRLKYHDCSPTPSPSSAGRRRLARCSQDFSGICTRSTWRHSRWIPWRHCPIAVWLGGHALGRPAARAEEQFGTPLWRICVLYRIAPSAFTREIPLSDCRLIVSMQSSFQRTAESPPLHVRDCYAIVIDGIDLARYLVCMLADKREELTKEELAARDFSFQGVGIGTTREDFLKKFPNAQLQAEDKTNLTPNYLVALNGGQFLGGEFFEGRLYVLSISFPEDMVGRSWWQTGLREKVRRHLAARHRKSTRAIVGSFPMSVDA